MSCLNCIHCTVCKYMQEFMETEKANKKELDKEYISVEVKCKHYKESVPHSKEITYVPADNTHYSSPCLTCSYYKQIKAGGIYVGDAPCQWCQYSPTKVTCSDSTSTSRQINGV